MFRVSGRGGAPATTAALANQVEVLSLSMPPVVPHIKAGRLKGLAISSLKRVPALQEVPTVTEAGFPGFEERSWVGYFAPAKTGPLVVRKLNGEINKALGMADVRTRLDALGLEPQPVSPAEFATYVKAEIAKWAKIVKTTGITAD
jgi:tripartite-type tricarboxylate transporter receptor subunit TctC